MSVYVMSDLHGRKDKYKLALQKLNEEDHLYILGDVIDRGNDGIAILLDIMQRKNVTLLMGNHEKMMVDFLRADEDGIGTKEDYELHNARWNRNGSEPTKKAYNALDPTTKQALRRFLDQLPYAICDLEVNGRIFYLCHAYPIQRSEGILYEKDLSEEECQALTWNRFNWGEVPDNQRINIVGHTPTPYYQERFPVCIYEDLNEADTEGLIDVDCGLASKNDHARAGLLCLDDLSVCYL